MPTRALSTVATTATCEESQTALATSPLTLWRSGAVSPTTRHECVGSPRLSVACGAIVAQGPSARAVDAGCGRVDLLAWDFRGERVAESRSAPSSPGR